MNVVVTGGNRGLGLELVRGLAKAGARVCLTCRDASSGSRIAHAVRQETGNEEVECRVVDLSSMRQAQALSQSLRHSFAPVDVLVNNAAGITARSVRTAEGLDQMFAVNYLSAFLLTRELLGFQPRVINLSSNAHRWVPALDFANLQGTDPFDFRKSYGAQKLMNLLHVMALRERGLLDAEAHHPGEVATGLGYRGPWYLRAYWTLALPFRLDPAKAAEPVWRAALAQDRTGTPVYFEEGQPVQPSSGANPADASRLWDASEQLLEDLDLVDL